MFVERRFLAGLAAGAALGFAAPPAAGQGDAVVRQSTPVIRSDSQDAEEIDLQIGEQRVLSTDNVRSYSEGSKGVVDVRLTKDASQFVVVAQNPGITTLLFLMMDGSERRFRFTVTDPRAQKTKSADRGGTVEARDNIRLDFYFVELDRSYRRQVGIGWPASIAPTFTGAFNFKDGALDSATAIITDQALPRLDMAESAGWAKVMRQAAVVTANGEKASFSGGGEVNIAVQSALTSGIHKIPFGSIIEVEPRYDSNTGRIELKLHADISELQSDRGSGVPGRTTSALDTIVNIDLGQSLILAGLTARSERTEHTGLPGLSQIPILGIFFGTHGHVEDDTENVVVIVPSVVDAVSMQDRERLSDALRRYQEFSGNLDDVKLVPEARVKPSSKREKKTP
jgi:pilus assembly protein CpaC